MSGKENILREKSKSFSITIVQFCKYLRAESREYILSDQLLRSATSVGAMVRESEYSESKSDFIHKLAIAQKENNEALYWLEVLYETGYMDLQVYERLHRDGSELIKIITASIRTAKQNLAHQSH